MLSNMSPIANPEFTISQHNPDLIWDQAEIGRPAVLIIKSLDHPRKSDWKSDPKLTLAYAEINRKPNTGAA